MTWSLEGYEENNPADIEISEFFPLIQTHWQRLSLDEVKFHYHGSYNVFKVRGKYILRIPDRALRNEVGLAQLHTEFEVLQFFHHNWSAQSQISIPQPLYLHDNPDLPYLYYEMIPGRSLGTIFTQLTQPDQVALAQEIRNFLDFFHSKDLAAKFQQKFPHLSEFSAATYFKHWETFFEFIQTKIYPFLTQEGQTWLERLFTSFLAHPDYCQFTPTISHGDFDTSNILVAGNPPKLTAIIDFEDVKLGDPAADLLFFQEGQDFLDAILSPTGITYDPYIRNRMKFLFCRTCIPYIRWGLEHGRQSMVEYGIKRLKMLMQIFPNSDVDEFQK